MIIVAKDKELIEKILKAHLPEGSKVYAFGSRVTGSAKKYSDLDLLIESPQRLSETVSEAIENTFAESDLGFKIDFHDVHALDEAYLASIQKTKVLFC